MKQNPSAYENTASSVKDDLAELNSIILLPFIPKEVVWKEEDKKLIAVMRFSQEDEKRLIEKAKNHGQPEKVEVSVEDWFPPELLAQIELSGDETLKGISYSAKDFTQMPYKTGRIIKLENSNYFVLELLSD
ncbi:MAG: hypothetical protein N2Z23_09120 [Pyrinomonadaceae bacterium]|nr:hypothetical protein [Pyrinomonadaceae bacterium]MCX7640582.1 hypothetical protein [Pyrinomonadaceae bacterium]MDW8303837.1 hypothetical protein [Acidobacteriota bacterium]